MKKFLVIFGMIGWLSMPAMAQDNENQKPDGGRLEALKIAWLTKKLNLTPEEAQRFWPVYNQYSGEIKNTRENGVRQNVPEIVIEQQVLDIRKRYNGEFTKAVGPQRADQFFKLEKKFGAYVTEELMQRRQLRLQQRRNLRP
ncbi:MAG: hypothetical protein JST47_02065 [Bacteroidetes bacterium]|nr:hypothetical protein [Bacteroidota bacterium]MBS1972744.1 hypothetical protein [Bacteroidota bacterium]